MKPATLLLGSSAASLVCASTQQNLHVRQSTWTVGQTVTTSSGPVNGHASPNTTEVSEYLGIPFAQPPVGDLRFAPPQKYTGNSTINGTDFGYGCPIQSSPQSTDPAVYLEQNITIPQGIQILATLAQVGEKFSEDCLTVNVWTKPQTGESKKAVLLWIYGGGFNSGSSNGPAYHGQYIANSEDVVVVSFNYRINIFGFPGNPAGANNIGLLDQRLAVEWVRDNIEAFGGDPSRITIFGQSAGGASVDYYSFAWTSDPIVAGFIPQSGTAGSFGLPHPVNESAASWFNVTATLNCGDAASDAQEVLSCMRTKEYTEILNAIPHSSGLGSVLGGFGPTVDEKVLFSDYPARAAAGNFIKRPVLIGNNDYEAGLFITTLGLTGTTFPASVWDTFNLDTFTCPAAVRAAYSAAADVPTWRYRYFGEFPNLRIAPGSGAWHGAEIPLIFNNTPLIPAATEAEVSISNYLRGAWAAFAKDPVNGLDGYEGGWPQYQPEQETLIRLGYNNITGTNLALPSLYDAGCAGIPVNTTNSTATSTATSSAPVATSTTSGASRISVSTLSVVGLLLLALWMS
ncbi:carboxylesterase [Phlyctema vagabunda]|uniref:Carboxylic ester hydrolase n=1 Tax=Phlyctema vagabunda TaxID=108571 RepID=A0ABR4PLF9_9HELO